MLRILALVKPSVKCGCGKEICKCRCFANINQINRHIDLNLHWTNHCSREERGKENDLFVKGGRWNLVEKGSRVWVEMSDGRTCLRIGKRWRDMMWRAYKTNQEDEGLWI